MISFSRYIDSFNEWIGRIFSWAIVVLTLLAVFEVIARVVFNSPTIWGFEVTTQIFGAYFMVIAGYALLHKSHVSVDAITYYLSPKQKAAIDVCAYFIFFFPFSLVCIWHGYFFATKSWAIKEVSMTVYGGALYPIKTVILISFVLLFLQGISEVTKKIAFLMGGKNT